MRATSGYWSRQVPVAACPTPGKIAYGSKSRAKLTITRMRNVDARGRMRAYRCECGVWHVGHLPGSGRKRAA